VVATTVIWEGAHERLMRRLLRNTVLPVLRWWNWFTHRHTVSIHTSHTHNILRFSHIQLTTYPPQHKSRSRVFPSTCKNHSRLSDRYSVYHNIPRTPLACSGVCFVLHDGLIPSGKKSQGLLAPAKDEVNRVLNN
jgi:hypothetical protein